MRLLIDWLLSLISPRPPAPRPSTPVDSPSEPARILNRNVLLLVFDPVMEPATGRTLSHVQHWQRVEQLVSAFIGDLLRVSAGLARYQIAQRVDIDEFPVGVDGFRYTPAAYLDVLRGIARPHLPQEANYQAILRAHNIPGRVASGEIDEVWIFAFPHAGFYESRMAGPAAFWCNAPALRGSEASGRRYVVMGFSYERTVGEMHESYCHRVESIMGKTFERLTGEANLWQRFTRYDRNTPGKAACGNVHFAPNSVRDYDWNNPAQVMSECYDWLRNFPHLKGDVRVVNASEWGGGDIRAHHTWWLNHLPKVAGRTFGIHNNWWQYVVDPNRVST
jgi:hypothetical protein